jgi:FtsP/CotA-like multicopper oxidase with cupredoxin domain
MMLAEARRFGDAPAFGFVLATATNDAPPARVPVPGPTLVLKRGEPVEITLVNKLPEGTAIHWHGMELESYYDGVHGWSGIGQRVTPMIEPGGSFVVRVTPPRTGTFM